MHETAVPPRPTARLLSVVGDGDVDRFRAALARAGAALGQGTLWHINSTAEGGGVAELLRANLGYLSGNGVRVRWAIFDGDPRFFQITKRIHNRLHGDAGDGGNLGDDERAHYDDVTRRNADEFAALVGAGDVVVVHDPQPAGLIPAWSRPACTSCGRATLGSTRRTRRHAPPGRSFGHRSSPRRHTCSLATRTCGKDSTGSRSS